MFENESEGVEIPRKPFPLPPKRIPPAPPAPKKKAPKAPELKILEGLPKNPPLFVKVEKYKDLMQSVKKLKSYSISLRDAIDALTDIEKELQAGLSITHKALDAFNTIISVLDAKLSSAHSAGDIHIEEAKSEVKPPKEIENYVKSLYEQIERIRSELKSIS